MSLTDPTADHPAPHLQRVAVAGADLGCRSRSRRQGDDRVPVCMQHRGCSKGLRFEQQTGVIDLPVRLSGYFHWAE